MTLQTLLVGCGFAIFLAMNSFSLWGFAFLPQAAFGDAAALWSTPLALCNSLGFFVYALGSRTLPRLFNRAPRVEGAALMAVGLILLVGFFSTGSTLLLGCAGALVGVGTTCCFICWELVFSASPPRTRRAQILLGSVLSIVPFSLLYALPGNALFSTALLAFLNFAFLFGLATRLKASSAQDAPFETGNVTSTMSDREDGEDAAVAKPLLCIVMIGLISPILGASVGDNAPPFIDRGLLVHAANLVSALILFALWFGLRKRITISRAYAVIFPVLITACVLFPFLNGGYRTFALFIGSLGFSLFSIVMMMSCIGIARTRRESLVFIYALFAGVTYVSRLIGLSIGELIKAGISSPDMQIALSAFVLLYGCSLVMFVVMRKGTRSTTERTSDSPERTPAFSATADSSTDELPLAAESAAHTGDAAAIEGIDVLAARCRALAKTHGFSERQTEVLDLLAHGYDVPAIAEKLFISENTVRTHTKKIYAATGVHAKRDLIDLVNGVGADYL